jgi:hypothetical protein
MEEFGDFVYNKKDLIGHGAFAIVYRGKHKTVSPFSSNYIPLLPSEKHGSRSQSGCKKEFVQSQNLAPKGNQNPNRSQESKARKLSLSSEMCRDANARVSGHGILQWRGFGRLSSCKGSYQ